MELFVLDCKGYYFIMLIIIALNLFKELSVDYENWLQRLSED